MLMTWSLRLIGKRTISILWKCCWSTLQVRAPPQPCKVHIRGNLWEIALENQGYMRVASSIHCEGSPNPFREIELHSSIHLLAVWNYQAFLQTPQEECSRQMERWWSRGAWRIETVFDESACSYPTDARSTADPAHAHSPCCAYAALPFWGAKPRYCLHRTCHTQTRLCSDWDPALSSPSKHRNWFEPGLVVPVATPRRFLPAVPLHWRRCSSTSAPSCMPPYRP